MERRNFHPLGAEDRNDFVKGHARRPRTLKLQGKNEGERQIPGLVHLDTSLRIMTHVRKIKARSTEKFALAAIAKRDWDQTCMLTLYNSIFIPIATYAAAS